MAAYQLDEIDEQLISLLQKNSRYAATELAERIGVSDNTIHNRIDRLEEAGVITGYTTTVDHEVTGLTLYFLFTCTARISNRGAVAENVLEIPNVVEVTELMTGQRNLQIKVLAADDRIITSIAERLDQLDLEINDENLIRAERTQPLDYSKVEIPEE